MQKHPVHTWSCPIRILYGSGDSMMPRRTAEEYARRHNAELTVAEGGGALVSYPGTACGDAGMGGERTVNTECTKGRP